MFVNYLVHYMSLYVRITHIIENIVFQTSIGSAKCVFNLSHEVYEVAMDDWHH